MKNHTIDCEMGEDCSCPSSDALRAYLAAEQKHLRSEFHAHLRRMMEKHGGDPSTDLLVMPENFFEEDSWCVDNLPSFVTLADPSLFEGSEFDSYIVRLPKEFRALKVKGLG